MLLKELFKIFYFLPIMTIVIGKASNNNRDTVHPTTKKLRKVNLVENEKYSKKGQYFYLK